MEAALAVAEAEVQARATTNRNFILRLAWVRALCFYLSAGVTAWTGRSNRFYSRGATPNNNKVARTRILVAGARIFRPEEERVA